VIDIGLESFPPLLFAALRFGLTAFRVPLLGQVVELDHVAAVVAVRGSLLYFAQGVSRERSSRKLATAAQPG
jgi:hypothetical protein